MEEDIEIKLNPHFYVQITASYMYFFGIKYGEGL